ncbi:hypothetical protein MMC25_006020 [Agyrium rufum]|nr:hypothetical protein [Agyrium rufum]
MTALDYATRVSNVNVCKVLLHAGADPFWEDYSFSGINDYSSAFHTAWVHILGNRGNKNTLAQLQSMFPEKIFLEESNFTLLHRTTVGLNSMGLKVVLDNLSKAEIDQGDQFNGTALWWAAKRGELSKVHVLLQYGADINKASTHVNKASKFGTSPFQAALMSRNQDYVDIVATMLQHGFEIDAKLANLDCLKILYEHNPGGMEFNGDTGVKGATPMQIAEKRTDVSPEWLEMFRKLLSGNLYLDGEE